MKKLLLIVAIISSFLANGQVPNQINYQGVARNSVGNVIPNKKIMVRLSIREGSDAGAILYKETRTIATNNFGLFNIAIGSTGADNTTGTISGIDWSSAAKFIQVEIDPEGGSNFINMGAAQLLSVPYALYAGRSSTGLPSGAAGGVLTGTFPNPSIANGVITQSMLAGGVIPTSLPPSGNAGGDLIGVYPNPTINNGVITTNKLADNSITTSKIIDASVTGAKLAAGVIPTSLPPNGNAGGDLNGVYPNPTIKNGAITNGKLADNAVTTSKVVDGSITMAKLGPDVILSGGGTPIGPAGGDLAGSYPNPAINNGAITSTKLADNSVTTLKIVDASVTSAKLAVGVIPSSLPPNGTAGGDLIGSYPNPTINNSAITSAKLADGAVTNTKVADNAITTTKVVDGSITMAKLGPDVILGGGGAPIGPAGGDLAGSYPNPAINNGAITSTKLADNSVTTSKIVDASVTSIKLAPGVIPTSLPPNGTAGGDLNGIYPNPIINNGAINTTKLADNSVTTSKIVDASVTSIKLAPGVIPTSLPPNGTAGGDLNGTYPNPVVNRIQNIAVSNTAPANGQVLKFNGTQWVPATDDVGSGGGSNPTGPAGGDLNGTYPNPNLASGSVTIPKIANGAVITPKIADDAVTTNKLADNAVTTVKVADGSITMAKLGPDVILGGGGAPTGPAGGDLAGTYPNPTINSAAITSIKLADNSVTTSKIVDASVTSAKLAVGVIPTSLPPSGTAGGDLNGSYPNPTLNKIQGVNVTATGATTGQVLKFDGTAWIPGTDNTGSGGGATGPAGGDLTGSYPNPAITTGAVTSTKLADNSVTTLKIVDASVTSAKLAAGVIPTSLPPNGAAGGDLTGSYPNPLVSKIQNIGVSNTAPVNGQILKFNGTQWAPAAESGGSFTLPYSSSASNAANLMSLTNTGTGSGLEGVNSSTNANVSGIIGRITSTTPGAMAAGVKGINSGTGTNGIGVYGSHLGNGYGVYGNSAGGTGVFGNTTAGFGIYGKGTTGIGVYGESISGNAGSFSVSDVNNSVDAVYVSNLGQGNGIYTESTTGNGLTAVTNNNSSSAIWGFNNSGGVAIHGVTFLGTGAGIKGSNTTNGGTAVEGELLGVTTGNVALFKVDGANVARINQAGKGFFNGGTQNSGADVAEAFDVEGDRNSYEPGDVLIISQSSDRKVEKSNTPYSTLVAGVYATKPGLLLTEKNAMQESIDEMVPMGVIGVIPVKVCLEGGNIKRGDMLVTSSITGVAMKADPDKVKVGQVLGKALEDYSAEGTGKIKVLVSIK